MPETIIDIESSVLKAQIRLFTLQQGQKLILYSITLIEELF